MLDLDVEVRDVGSQEVLYRSSKFGPNKNAFEARVVIYQTTETDVSKRLLRATSHLFVIPSGNTLFVDKDQDICTLSMGRVPYEHVIKDVCGQEALRFLQGYKSEQGVLAGRVLGLMAALLQRDVQDRWYKFPPNYFINGRSRGIGLFLTLTSWLPEINAAETLKDTMQDTINKASSRSMSSADLRKRLHTALREVEGICCGRDSCRKYRERLGERLGNNTKRSYCLASTLYLICHLGQIFSGVELKSMILPSAGGLHYLLQNITRLTRDAKEEGLPFYKISCQEDWAIENIISHLFAGQGAGFAHEGDRSAFSVNGICFMLNTFLQPTDDIDNFDVIQIAQGILEHDSHAFRLISKMENFKDDTHEIVSPVFWFEAVGTQPKTPASSPQVKCELLVEEELSSVYAAPRLLAAWRLTSDIGTLHISPSYIRRVIRYNSAVAPNCRNCFDCDVRPQEVREAIFLRGISLNLVFNAYLPTEGYVIVRDCYSDVLSRWIMLAKRGLHSHLTTSHDHAIFSFFCQGGCLRCSLGIISDQRNRLLEFEKEIKSLKKWQYFGKARKETEEKFEMDLGASESLFPWDYSAAGPVSSRRIFFELIPRSGSL